MKTIKDLTIENINEIYSIIIGRKTKVIKIEWSTDKDFVIASFKVEKCKVSENFDKIEYGIHINEDLEVKHVWTWWNKTRHVVDCQPLYNHHKITKYMLQEGFNV